MNTNTNEQHELPATNRLPVELWREMNPIEYRIADYLLYRSELEGWDFYITNICQTTNLCRGIVHKTLKRFAARQWVRQDEAGHYHLNRNAFLGWVRDTYSRIKAGSVHRVNKKRSPAEQVVHGVNGERSPGEQEAFTTRTYKEEYKEKYKEEQEEEDKEEAKLVSALRPLPPQVADAGLHGRDLGRVFEDYFNDRSPIPSTLRNAEP